MLDAVVGDVDVCAGFEFYVAGNGFIVVDDDV